MDRYADQRDLELLEGDKCTFAVLSRILKGTCRLILTQDHQHPGHRRAQGAERELLPRRPAGTVAPSGRLAPVFQYGVGRGLQRYSGGRPGGRYRYCDRAEIPGGRKTGGGLSGGPGADRHAAVSGQAGGGRDRDRPEIWDCVLQEEMQGAGGNPADGKVGDRVDFT